LIGPLGDFKSAPSLQSQWLEVVLNCLLFCCNG